jgi:hypothetical protein
LPGGAVQGLVQIAGTVDINGFQSYMLEFAFEGNAESSWFPITQSATPIINGILGEWDTSLLIDQTYALRLTVNIQNSDPMIIILEGVRVRNYTAIETSTPTPTSLPEVATPTLSITSTPTLTPTPNVTPTPPPANSAAVGPNNVRKAAQTGLLIGLFFILFITIYQSRLNKKNKY